MLSSLTRARSSALVCSTCLPVSDCGTGTVDASFNGFSRQRSISQFASTVVSAPHHPSPLRATGLNRDIQHPDGLASCVTMNVKRVASGSRMLTASPSPTPFGLGLGPTHPGRINLPQEPLDFRRIRFSRILSLLIPAFSLPPRPAILIE